MRFYFENKKILKNIDDSSFRLQSIFILNKGNITKIYFKISFISKGEVEVPYIVSSDFEIDDHPHITNVTMQVGGMACIIKWIDWYIDDVMVQSQPSNFIANDQVWAPFVDWADFGDICSNLKIYAGIRFSERDSVQSNHFTYFKNESIKESEFVILY